MQIVLTLLDGARWQGQAIVGARVRTLLETLTAAGSSGSSENSLIEAVWGADRPLNPTKALQVLVSRVRATTDARVIARTSHGYRLGLDRDEVDVLVQADRCQAAETAYAAGDLDTAVQLARQALEFGEFTAAQRVFALAASRTGDHTAALPLLKNHNQAHPTDEDALACLLRSESTVYGPATALDRYERHRVWLADRFGTDPGPALQDVYRELLAADNPVRNGVRYDSTALLGREDDIRALRALLYESRVVSVTGPGGVGKTRIAHMLGRISERPFVHFIELVGVADPQDVVAEVGSILGVRNSVTDRRTLTFQQRADIRSRIAQQLDTAPTLLILDNCEHLIDAVADLVAFLVATTRDLRVVTTTRAPLSIASERVYALDQLGTATAVELFRQRATAARPTVVLADDDVADLVDRLDGLPLAIELAAAKTRVMSVADISSRLADRFALLRGGDRSAPDRHQTLLAVIDWSWNLLTQASQRALRWLAVFHDGFTADTAETMLGPKALDTIQDLVDQSLLVVAESDAGVRYRMLETVREFGGLRLVDADEHSAAAAAQRAWARDFSEQMMDQLRGPMQVEALGTVDVEETNLADVLRQSLAEPDRETVVTVLAALASLWNIKGEHARILVLFDAVENAMADWTPDPSFAEATRVALAAVCSSAVSGVARYLPQSMRLLDELGPVSQYPSVTAACVLLRALEGDHRSGSNRELDELCEHRDRHIAMRALRFRAHTLENQGEPDRAASDVTRALALTRDEDGPWLRAAQQAMLAQLYGQLGRHEEAEPHARDAAETLDQLAAIDDAVQCRVVLACAAIIRADYAAAEELRAGIESRPRGAMPHVGLGNSFVRAELALAQGQVEVGLATYREGIVTAREFSIPGYGQGTGREPWVLSAESAGLAACSWYATGEAGRDLWQLLREKLIPLLRADEPYHDYPVLGMILFALGTWSLLRADGDSAVAIRMLVLAEKFAYSRIFPVLEWNKIVSPAEHAAPGLLAQLRREYGQRRGPALLSEARAVTAMLAN